MTTEDLGAFFRGELLYGDDFSPEEIAEWFDDEREGYANLGARDRTSYRYAYHALNQRHGFRHLPAGLSGSVLSFGGAYGDELVPIARRFEEVVIADVSQAFRVFEVEGVPVRYVEPRPDGTIPVPDEAFGLVTCLGVLHHIPNVTAVVRELGRCLRQGGYALVREPVFSMGDWRRPRPDLTKRERGIPAHILRSAFGRAGLTIVRETPCGFRPLARLTGPTRGALYNSAFLTLVDSVLSRAFAWNQRYHAVNALQKIQPASVFFVLQKPM